VSATARDTIIDRSAHRTGACTPSVIPGLPVATRNDGVGIPKAPPDLRIGQIDRIHDSIRQNMPMSGFR
jgi:hypothetical protein